MKKIISLYAVITAIISVAFLNPVTTKFSYDVIPVINDTVSNSMSKTGYLFFDESKIVDSIQFVLYAGGEIDVDKFIATKAFEYDTSPARRIIKNYGTGTGDTTILDTDLDSAVTSVTYITTWAGSKLQGANAVYCQINAASSGNDASDPNSLKLFGIVYYRPE